MTAKRSNGIGRWAKKWPIATSLGALLALAIAALPELARLAQFQADTSWSQPWRIFTSHFAHFSAQHLTYDLIVFVGLGLACEMRWPTRTRWTLALSACTIPLAFLATTEHLTTYRGLSGLGSALLVLLAARLHEEQAFTSRITRFIPLVTCLGFLAKVSFELYTGQTVFLDETVLFEPVPVAHLVGGLIGLAVAWLPGERAPVN